MGLNSSAGLLQSAPSSALLRPYDLTCSGLKLASKFSPYHRAFLSFTVYFENFQDLRIVLREYWPDPTLVFAFGVFLRPRPGLLRKSCGLTSCQNMGLSTEVDSILLVLFPIIEVVILSLVNRKGGYSTTILSW
jgi:hypothetical protein